MRNLKDFIDKLAEIRANCSSKEWDGYDASPVYPEMIDDAAVFVTRIVLGDFPDVVPENDGSIGLTWEGKDQIFYITAFSADYNAEADEDEDDENSD